MSSLEAVPDEKAHRYDASLRVFSRSLTAAELTHALGRPSSSYDVGDPVSHRRPKAGKRKQALWLLESGLDESNPLDQHITALLDFIDAHRKGFAAIRPQCESDIFCGVSSGGGQGGFALEPELVNRLADVGLAVVFDIY
jgi:uncharacterized protein DUF4279